MHSAKLYELHYDSPANKTDSQTDSQTDRETDRQTLKACTQVGRQVHSWQ